MVAGEPVEVQVRLEDKLEACTVNAVILGGAVRRRHGCNAWISTIV